MIRFADRFAALSKTRSPLCLGLDPSEETLARWGLPQDAEGLHRFCATVLEAAGDRVAAIKPQAGFFERFGPAGAVELAASACQAREQGALSLIDAKRGDVPGTMEGYAAAMLGADSGFGGDAMTANAYLGFEALEPALTRAAAVGACVFVVVHSSNPEGRSVQDARLADGRSLTESLADTSAARNARDPGAVGVVVGATIAEEATALLDRLGDTLVLAPGVGAQGADMAGVGRRFAAVRGRVLPSVSRDILRHGPDVGALRDAIDRYRDEAWAACGA